MTDWPVICCCRVPCSVHRLRDHRAHGVAEHRTAGSKPGVTHPSRKPPLDGYRNQSPDLGVTNRPSLLLLHEWARLAAGTPEHHKRMARQTFVRLLHQEGLDHRDAAFGYACSEDDETLTDLFMAAPRPVSDTDC